MVKWIEECSLEIWLKALKKIDSNALSLSPKITDNLFSSMQFVDDEISIYKRHKAYTLNQEIDNQVRQIAWASIYYLSPRVLRIRGLFVLEGFRQQRNMSHLLWEIIRLYSGCADNILSFSTPSGIEFHENFGFEKVDGFIPRPVERYDYKTRKYSCDTNEFIQLYKLKI